MAERIPPATRTLAVAAHQLVSSLRGAYANALVTDINADKLREPTYIRLASHRTLSLSPSLSLSLSLPLSLIRCKSGRGWSNSHCPWPRDAVSPLSLPRSFPIVGGAVTVTVAAVEARHTHSTLHMMRNGDGRLLSRVTAVNTWPRRPSHDGAAASPSSSSASFERRGARYRSRYE